MIHFIPIHRPSLLRRPLRVVGIPVARAIDLFALVTPSARFHEKESPGPSFINQAPQHSVAGYLAQPYTVHLMVVHSGWRFYFDLVKKSFKLVKAAGSNPATRTSKPTTRCTGFKKPINSIA